MRIAVNTRVLIKDKLEGIGRFSFELLKVMARQHPNDEFIFFFDRASTHSTDGFDQSFLFSNNIIPVVVSPPARHPFLWYWWFEKAIPKAIEKYKPDVFLSPDGYCSLKADVKTVLVIHDIGHQHFPEDTPFLVRKYYHHYVPKYLAKADKVITVSHFVKEDIAKIYGIEKSKMSVTCNACSEDFMPFSESEKKKTKEKFSEGYDYFLYTGAIHPRKNVDQLIKAFDHFKTQTNAAAKLLIAGRMAWKNDAVHTAYQEAKHKNDIQLLGFVSTEDLVALMASAKCFTYVSRHEGFGIPLLEAMQSGVPIITSNVSALPEVAKDAALLVDPNNMLTIADAMEKIWMEESLRQNLIQKGLERRKDFTWEKAAEIVYEQIKLVANKNI